MKFNNKMITLAIASCTLVGGSLRAQKNSGIQHIKFDDAGWEQMAPKLQRKYVYGEKGMLALFKMDKGAKVPVHNHPNEQTTYITKGSVKVTMEGRVYTVKAGEVLIIPANIPHEFECLEDGTLDFDFFAPPRTDWINGTADYFGNPEAAGSHLETVASLDIRPGNVAVSANGRIFATIHPLGSQKTQLVEIVKGKAVAYPDERFQKNNQSATNNKFDAMLGLIVDKKDRLWVTDMGLELGTTRLWCFDIDTNKVIEKIELPQSVAPKGSFLQDVVIDEKNNWAYLADISDPGIIAIDLKTKKARRFSGHNALLPEDKDMVIDNKVIYFDGKPARVAIDPITISEDRETLFFGAMNGTTWYKVPAKLFRENKNDEAIGRAITVAGNKPFSDGATTDAAGNHYFTNLQEHSITKLSSDGILNDVIQNNSLLLWPDNICFGPDNWMYISANQLNTTPAFTGNMDEGKPPYFIFRFKLK